MRIAILVLALTLAACGGDESANTAAVTDESSSADLTAVNDITAIDAATGEAAQMAADVNYMLDENEVNGADENAANSVTNESR